MELREAIEKQHSSTGLWATGSYTPNPGPAQTETSAPALGGSKQIVENFEAEDQRRRALLGTCIETTSSQSFAFQYMMSTAAQVRSVNEQLSDSVQFGTSLPEPMSPADREQQQA